jgi:hypothetical protein
MKKGLSSYAGNYQTLTAFTSLAIQNINVTFRIRTLRVKEYSENETFIRHIKTNMW